MAPMHREDAAMLGLRLLAIYTWVQGLGYLASVVMGTLLSASMNQGTGSSPNIGWMIGLAPAAAYLVIGLALFVGSRSLMHWVLPASDQDANPTREPAASPLTYAAIAFAAVGV